MRTLSQWLGDTRHILELERELKRLRGKIAELEQQNDSMRTGMRRCLSCDYRLESRQREEVADKRSEDTAKNKHLKS